MKIVGASTPGIAAPGHADDLVERRVASAPRPSRSSRDRDCASSASAASLRSAQRVSASADRRRRSRSRRAPCRASADDEAVDDRLADARRRSGSSGSSRAIVLAGCSSSSRGKKADDRNRITNTSGKMPCTTLALPAPSASAAPSAPNARRAQPDQQRATSDERRARRPGCARRRSGRSRGTRRPQQRPARGRRPAARARSTQREIGAAIRRSMKPISMSSASAMPAADAGQHRRLHHRARRAGSRGSRAPAGTPGRSIARPAPPVLTARNSDREDDDRREELRPPERLPDRAPAERRDDAPCARAGADHARRPALPRAARPRRACSPAPSRWRPVFATNTSSSVGLTRSSDSTQQAGLVERAHDRRDVGRAVLEAHHQRCRSRRACSSPKRARTSAACSAVALGDPRSRGAGARSAPSAPRACPRPPSRPSSMIPTRSASWSASSRYCVVRKTVVPSSLSLRTSSQIAQPADRVEPGRRLVEEQHARLVHERRREVEPAAHAARVGADAAVGGAASGRRASSSASLRRFASARGKPVQRRLELHQLAPGHQRVERSLLERDADRARAPCAASLHDVEAGHASRCRRSACSSVVSIRTVVVLPGAVRPEERVDLPLGDLQVDPGDRQHLVREPPLELLDLDRSHGQGC